MQDGSIHSFPLAAHSGPRMIGHLWPAMVRAWPVLNRMFKGAAGFAAALAAWEGLRAAGIANPQDFPSLGIILRVTLAGLWGGDLSASLVSTLASWGPGLLIAAVLGMAAGIALGLSPHLDNATRPLLEFIRPIPSVALIPVALLIFGIGIELQLFLITFASIWPVLFATKSGIEGIDPRFLETGRIFGLGRCEQITRVMLPAALPMAATGLRTASAIALALAITVEILTGRPGIGTYIETARLNGLVPEMWAGIFVTGILGVMVNSLAMTIERHALPWSPENHAH